MKQFHFTLISILILLSLEACNKDPKNVSTLTPGYDPVKVERLDLAITDLPSSSAQLLDSMKAGLDIYLPVLGFSADSVQSALPAIYESPLTATFGVEVRDRFPSADSIELELGRISQVLADTLPAIHLDRVFGVISPYNQSVIVADSTVLVALNHYMGSSYEAYSAIPEPLRLLKTPDRIPIDIAEAMIRVNYPFRASDNPTMLERMLYEGAVATALSTLFPDSGREYIFGLSQDVYMNSVKSIPLTWNDLSSSGLLYSTDTKAVSQLFSRLPNPDFPPYSGPILGLHIVKSYVANNPSVTQTYRLSPDFFQQAQTRLIEAKFDAQSII